MKPSLANLLNGCIAALKNNAAIIDGKTLSQVVEGRIFNHIPQDSPLPCVRVRVSGFKEWDVKDANGGGYDYTLTIDVWTKYRGDLEATLIADRITNIMDMQPVAVAGFQNLYLREVFKDFTTESDGLTHRAILQFQGLAAL